MQETRQALNRFLVDVFHNILRLEEIRIRKAGYADLSITEMHVIEVICLAAREGRNTAKEIAAIRGVTPGTLSTTVKVLEKKGYVRRERDKLDGRLVWLFLTQRGESAFLTHEQIHHDMVDSVLTPLSDTDAEVLLGALERLSIFFYEEGKD